MISSDLNLLILEDDPIIAEDLYSFLTEKGYKVVHVAHDGTDAVNALATQKIYFAILDIHLGGAMSGIDVAKVINEKYKIPYIFLTSFDDEETLSSAQIYRPYGYIVKPFQERTLLTTIKIALSTFEKNANFKNTNKDKIESTLNQNFTEQEYKIISGFLNGKSYKSIAEEYHISINTVKYHAKNIYLKCDIKSRRELMAMLIN